MLEGEGKRRWQPPEDNRHLPKEKSCTGVKGDTGRTMKENEKQRSVMHRGDGRCTTLTTEGRPLGTRYSKGLSSVQCRDEQRAFGEPM